MTAQDWLCEFAAAVLRAFSFGVTAAFLLIGFLLTIFIAGGILYGVLREK